MARKPKPQLQVAGWKEIISLPGLGLRGVKAKLDTGARTAALHAADILSYESPDGPRVAFTVYPHPRIDRIGVRCTAPLIDRRGVTNSGGAEEERLVIEAEILLAGELWKAEITLTDRTRMRYPMLLGRSTIEGRFLVDPEQSYLLSSRKRGASR